MEIVDCNLRNLFVLQSMPVFTFANQAGLDMLETTLVALQDISLDKIFDEAGRKTLCADFSKLMNQVHQMFELSFLPQLRVKPYAVSHCSLIHLLSFPPRQGFAYLPAGICMSTMARHVSYEQAIAWKVLAAEENSVHCLAFSFINWSFV